MTNKIYTIDEIKQIVKPIAEKYKIEKVWLFGSYARGEATEKSDIDIFIKADEIKSLLIFSGLLIELQETFEKEIDLVTERSIIENNNDLNRKFYANITNERSLIYEPYN